MLLAQLGDSISQPPEYLDLRKGTQRHAVHLGLLQCYGLDPDTTCTNILRTLHNRFDK